ncbi:MAG: MerR family transcriptional regulator [Pseudomonadota bacterium]
MEKAPDAFRTISEVADELDVPQHVLRFWESRFPQIRPMKRAGGRRYYRPEDVDLLRGIRHLLYGEGYTIRGVQRILREQGPRFVQSVWQPGAAQPVLQPDEDAAAEPEQLPPDEAARTIFGLLKSPLGNPVAATPTQAESDEDESEEAADASPRVVAAPVGGLARDDVRRLQSALHELGECRRLLEDAVKEEAA